MQVINSLKAENNIISTKLRRVEGENVLKVRDCKSCLTVLVAFAINFDEGLMVYNSTSW